MEPQLTTRCSSPGGTDGLGAGRAGLDVSDDLITQKRRALHMNKQHGLAAGPVDAHRASIDGDLDSHWQRAVGRRSFLKGVGVAGAMAVPGSALLASQASAKASSRLTKGDVDILRMLALAELIEADLWQQYDELGGVHGGNPAYQAALTNIDGDMTTYVHLNNNDEQSHVAFLNAYLKS